MTDSLQNVLSESDVEHFVRRGFVKVPGCFSRELANSWTRAACERLYCDLDDPSSWPPGRMRAPRAQRVPMVELVPRAWAAAAQLLGGVERIGGGTQENTWGDEFLINFGGEANATWNPPSATIQSYDLWHKDGDFFRHFLDSPEQGLLVIALFSDLTARGGGTYLACDSVGHVARFLAERPEGVLPDDFPFADMVRRCQDFVEVTGEVGDVFLLHPFMLHSWSINTQQRPRFMTNPPVQLKDPMVFDRANAADQSPVERGVLLGLGVESYAFRAAAPRERLYPDRVTDAQKEWIEKARARRGQRAPGPCSRAASHPPAARGDLRILGRR
jgi:hypothetical protein